MKTMKIIVGSKSKRKIELVTRVIHEIFKNSNFVIEGYGAISGVPETPYDQQTFDGAKNRAIGSKENVPRADFYVGIESGLVERYGHIYEEAWCVIVNREGEEYYGYSSGLKVPDYILKRMDELNLPHSKVMVILEEEYSLPDSETWGNYSGGMIAREVSLAEALRNALIQVVAPDGSLYRKDFYN